MEGVMSDYEAARQELERIDATIAEWQEKLQAKEQQAASVHALVGQQVLSGKLTPQKAVHQVAALDDERQILKHMIAAAQAQRVHAKRQLDRARVAQLRDDAARLRQESEDLARWRNELLQQVAEIEGPLYIQNPRSHQLAAEADMLERAAFDLELRLNEPPRERDAQGNEIRRYISALPESMPVTRYEPSLQ
jgi:cell division septum initiation protein DivIVA